MAAMALSGPFQPVQRLATRPNFVAAHCPTIQRKIAVLLPAKQVPPASAGAFAILILALFLLESARQQITFRFSLADI
jgi:hypothetical protein